MWVGGCLPRAPGSLCKTRSQARGAAGTPHAGDAPQSPGALTAPWAVVGSHSGWTPPPPPTSPLQAELMRRWACWGRGCVLGLGRGFGAACRDWGTHAWTCALCSSAAGPSPACLPRPAPQMPGLPPAQTCPRSSQGPSFSQPPPLLLSRPLSYPPAPSSAPPAPVVLPYSLMGTRDTQEPRDCHWRRLPSPQPQGQWPARGVKPLWVLCCDPWQGPFVSTPRPVQGRATSCWGPRGRPEGAGALPAVVLWAPLRAERTRNCFCISSWRCFRGRSVLHDSR